jgi:hypothetical protein
MDCGDERFGLLDREGVDYRAVLLGNAKAFESSGRVVLLGMIAVAVLKCGSQGTYDVVVGLLADAPCIGNLYQCRVLDALEVLRSNRGAPYRVEDPAVAVEGGEREITLFYARLAALDELVKHVVACAAPAGANDPVEVAIIRELLDKTERPVGDARLDLLELLVCAAQVCFAGNALERRPIAHAIELEIELDSIRAFGRDASGYRPSTHRSYPIMSTTTWPSGACRQTLPSGQSPRSILRWMAFTEYPVSRCARGNNT